MLVRIPYDRTAERVAYLLAKKMETLPAFLRTSVTWDPGKEMARHADFTIRTGIPVYLGKRCRIFARQDRQESARRLRAGLSGIAAQMDLHVRRCSLGQRMGNRIL